MDISIIIPVYNVGECLKASVESVQKQTYKGTMEIILVDDGSSDNSLSVAEELAKTDKRIKVIHQENTGVSAARNVGLEMATGKYIMFLDGDDIITKTAIENLIDRIEGEPDAILSNGDNQVIHSYEEEIDEKFKGICVLDKLKTLEEILLGKYCQSVWAKIFIREKIGDLKFNVGISNNEDKYFLIQYLVKNDGVTVNVEQNIYGYYVRENSATKKPYSANDLTRIDGADRTLNEIERNVPELIEQARYNSIMVYLAVIKKIIRCKQVRREKDTVKKLRKGVLQLSKETPWKWGKNMERITLGLGTPFYVLCVKLADCLVGK